MLKRGLVVSLFAATFAQATLPGPAESQEKDPAQDAGTPETYTIFAGGDVNLARWVHQGIVRRGPESGFAAVRKDVEDADVALANLECVVSTKGDFYHKGEGRPYLYRARPEMLDVLTIPGFDVVTTGNNHAMDYGPDALLEQLEILDAVGIAHVGSGKNWDEAKETTYVKVGDLILGFINPEDYMPSWKATDKRPGVFHLEQEEMADALKDAVRESSRYADLLIFTPHWGMNWTDAPTNEMRDIAHAFIDAGGHAILGHSAHHVHGIEIYKGKPIVYDMGSLFFDTVKQNRMGLSAGWIMEFDSEGFKNLTIKPYRLLSCMTTPAKGSVLKQIKEIITKETAKLDSDLTLEDKGDSLYVAFEPQTPAKGRREDPAQIHTTGSTKPVPKKYTSKPSDVILGEAPEFCEGFTPIELDNGVKVLGYENAQAARPRKAFVSKVVLQVPGKLERRWETFVKGVRKDKKHSFRWRHPVADGAAIPETWEAGQIVVDKTLARPKRVPPGVYDLYWGMENLATRTKAKRKNATSTEEGSEDDPTLVHMGEIHILKKEFPADQPVFPGTENSPKDTEYNPDGTVTIPTSPWKIWGPVAGGVVLLIIVALIIIKKRKKKPGAKTSK